MSERVIQRRLEQARRGKRDPQRDYDQACQAVRKAHEAWKQAKTPKPMPVQERYAAALGELDICVKVLGISRAEAA